MQAAAMQATLRETQGKGLNSRLRKSGHVPAVIYGRHKESAMLQVEANELDRCLRVHGASGLITLDIGGPEAATKKVVLIKDMQRDGLTGRVIHLDFQEVSMDEKAKMTIPIVVIGEDGRHKDAGTVQHFLRELHVSGLPGDLPSKVSIDATDMKPGDSVRVSDVSLGEKVHIETGADDVIFSISHPHMEIAEETTADAAQPVQATSPAETKKKGD